MAALCNAQHERFARAIVAGRNASQAYRDAGYEPCRQNASRLMTYDDIQRRIAELKEQRAIDSKNSRDAENGRFLQGVSGNPVGRPKGSRNKLAEAFVADLHNEWEKSGATALKRVAQSDPVQFVKVVASVLPAKIDAQLNIDIGLFAEVRHFREAFKLARAHIGAEIEGELIDAAMKPAREMCLNVVGTLIPSPRLTFDRSMMTVSNDLKSISNDLKSVSMPIGCHNDANGSR